jgi:hypothetical protein
VRRSKHDIHCGRHSGFPPCCIAFFLFRSGFYVLGYDEGHRFESNYRQFVEKHGKGFGYVPCSYHATSRKRVRVKRCWCASPRVKRVPAGQELAALKGRVPPGFRVGWLMDGSDEAKKALDWLTNVYQKTRSTRYPERSTDLVDQAYYIVGTFEGREVFEVVLPTRLIPRAAQAFG